MRRYLLLIDPDGNLALGDVDSGARVPVGEPLDPTQGNRVTTATWSPLGRWTAWSVGSNEPGGVSEVRVHDEASNATVVLADAVAAFYMCPSPCGRYLSHLSPGPLGLELAVSEIATGDLRIIERGQPLFWAWSPDSLHIAVHVEDRVVVAAMDRSESVVLSEDAGRFIAPWWMPGGSVAMAIDGRIMCGGLDGSITNLVDQSVSGRFAVDPDGRRLAMIDRIEQNQRLVVLDLLTGEIDLVTTDQVAGFFWSPDGRRLASLVVASASELQWVVFDGKEVIRLAPFRPGRSWLEIVLPFFEQYSQSHAVWSGDSSQLVSVATNTDGSSVALVHGVDVPDQVEQIPNVEIAWWANE